MKETKREILEPVYKFLDEHEETAKLIFEKTLYETKDFQAAQLEYLEYINKRYKQLKGIIDMQIRKSL